MALTSVVVALVTAAAGFGFPNVAAAGPFVVPHASYTSSGNLCAVCHKPHDAFSDRYLFSALATSTGELGVCYSCHDGNLASTNIKVGSSNSFALASGHAVENTGNVSAADLTNVCSDCHTPHMDPGTRVSLYASKVNSITITAADNTWCLACHNDAQDWYKKKYGTAYPALGAPTLDATGYPTAGTFPGATDYVNAAKNAHIRIPASSSPTTRVAGDCLYCHSSHRGVSKYDSLVATFQAPVDATLAEDRASGTYAAVCFECHDGSLARARNVKQYATYNGASDAVYSGHRIKSNAASMPRNAPLPCYECHNPHGSSLNNSRLISDARGQNLGTSSADAVRKFCLTCHTTSDNMVWNSATATYTVVPGNARIAGLLRTGGAPASGPDFGKNWLLLKELSGHAQADAMSCYACHGAAYGAPADSNVHNPSPGVSAGATGCYVCHSDYKVMDVADGARSTVYHHVMGTSTVTYTGGQAPNTGAYPTLTTDLFCVSCHADHNYFNAAKGFNLRTNIASSTVTTAATDFVNSAGSNYGICVSCHKASLQKDTTNQKTGTAWTPKIVGADYATSSHQYSVDSSFGPAATSVFGANCSKCHNDAAAKQFQKSPYSFGTHFSAERNLLESFGVTVTDPLREDDCFGCHSATSDARGAATKPVADRDAYGMAGASMDASSQMTYKVFHLNTASNHSIRGIDQVTCANCHNPHTSSATTKVVDPYNAYNGMAYNTIDDKATFCLRCHNGAAHPAYGANSATWVPFTVEFNGPNDYDKTLYAARGHWSATGSIDASERVACGTCHDKHGSKLGNLIGVYNPANDKMEIRGAEITAADKSVCYACHTGPSTGYPIFTRATQGYPTDGTWPGKAVSDAYSKHTSCSSCHDVHGGTGQDALSNFSPTNFASCLFCHSLTSFGEIKSSYPVSVGGSNVVSARSGHRTKSAGNLPANRALPCYDCHNPHGSPSGFSVMVVTQSQGTTVAVGDTAGELTMGAGRTAADVRKFCFACHTTSDTAEGWTGAAMQVALATDRVEGISRVTDLDGQVLHLPDVSGHRIGDVGQSCYTCHGSDYGVGGSNVHNPSPGLSDGGQACYGCHTGLQTSMEDGVAPLTGATRASSYHHVLGGTVSAIYYDGDKAFAAGSYPTLTGEVFCLSCHVDHDKFNASKSGNLRADLTANPAAAASDYSTSSNTGVCTSCHTTSLTKQVGTDQKSDGSAATPKIVPGSAANQFGASAHSYYGISTFTDSTTFNGNCVKCHNDASTKDYQAPATRFSTHSSAARRILSVFGAAVTDPPSEERCYGCHTGDTAGNDYYGTSAMTQASRRIETQFAMTGSKHPVVAAGGSSVECENCHNPHVVTKTTGKVTDPANTYSTISFDTTATQATFCLKCHSATGSLPAYTVGAANYIPKTVTIDAARQAISNKSTNAARGHWTVNGSIGVGEEKSCAACHESHGSAYTKLLGAYDPATGTNKINGAAISSNDNSVCYACHFAASATYSRLASGYPTDGTWPGKTTYTTVYVPSAHTGSIHTTSTAVWPGKSYAGGDCKNCHDVHGATNTYDELLGTFNPESTGNDKYALCFNCHDGSPSTDNIAQFFPVAAGGTAVQTGSTRFGHKTLSAGTLPPGSAVPCYDCHNPHGSSSAYGLQIVTQTASNTTITIGDGASEITMTPSATASDVRNFCFSCHTTGDVGITQGWNGTAMAVVGAGAKFEGIDRTVYNIAGAHLKIPPVGGHYLANVGQSCYTCHGSSYGVGGSNVHNPSPGLSDGGQDCYGCHGAYQSSMEDSAGLKTGATREDSYHHVMGGELGDGDIAPNAGAYPTSQTDVYCVSCHADHNYFNANKGANLRADIATGTAGSLPTTNTDFINTGKFGICVSCHTGSLTKQGPGTEQQVLDGGAATTPMIPGGEFSASAHQYEVTSTFGGSDFRANCSKCHSDEQAKEFQTSTNRFGTHWSGRSGILNALGAFVGNPPQEEACYKCHTAAGERYGAAPAMTAAAKATQAEFAMLSKHDLTKVACVNCHNVHEATAANPVADPDNTYNSASSATTATINTYCLKCHDGTLPAQTVNGTTLIPWTVSANATANVAMYYATDGHGTAAANQDCRDCHEQHGSTLAHLLKTSVNGQAVATYSDAADEAQCLACHRTGGVASSANIARFYPTTVGGAATQSGTLPQAGGTRFGHRTKNASTILDAGSPLPCRTCHNAHGGNGSGYMLAVRTQVTAGVDTFIGDAAGDLAMSDANQTVNNENNVRKFCFTCHTTSDSSFGWDGANMSSVAAGCQVLGLGRTSGALKLPNIGNIPGHKQTETGYSCYLCHGDDFSEDNSVNVHNPAAGESSGGIPCYTCHTVYQNRMEDGIGTAKGTQNTTSYHHVLGSATAQGDTVTYPTSSGAKTDVYCLSCHVDHDLFSPLVNAGNQRSANLRASIGTGAPSAGVNTDFTVPSSTSYYATAFTDTPSDWTNYANSIGAPNGTVATSASDNVFEGRHSFALPGSFSNAVLTVRSQAAGPWGATGAVAVSQVRYPSSDIGVSSWVEGVAGADGDAFQYNEIDDPAPGSAHDGDATYIGGNNTVEYQAGISAPTIPAGATNISVDLVWTALDPINEAQTLTPRIRVGATNWYSGATQNPGTTYSTYTTTWATNPAGGAWTTATVNTLAGLGVDYSNNNTTYHVTQMYIEVNYTINATYNDTWAIQYSTDGGTTGWANVVGANATAEGALTDHTADLTGILTPANAANFRVRILGAAVGGVDNANTVEWDSSTVSISTGVNAQVCMSCHTTALTKDTTNQKSIANSTVTPPLSVTGFDASAHDYVASSTFSDGSTFNANCSKCHDSEIDGGGMERGASTTGFQTSTNKFSVHYSAAQRLLAAMGVPITVSPAEERVCYACHSLPTDLPKKPTANQDWYVREPMDAPSQAFFSLMKSTYAHKVENYSGIHKPSPQDEMQVYISANKHVECADCHNVHEAQDTEHDVGTNLVSGALKGVNGVEPVYTANANWTAPTSYTAVSAATEESQICFKCHSGANTNVTSWGGAGAAQWTDVGLDFNPNNGSYHPVIAALPSGTDSDQTAKSNQLRSQSQLRVSLTVPGWTSGGFTLGDTMYCSDCHASGDAASLGPHGSGVKWMLHGPNQAWPYTSAALNGTSGSTGFAYISENNSTGTQSNTFGPDNVFCLNCHVLPVIGNAHSTDDKHGGTSRGCVMCHVRVPHGSKTSRLIAVYGSNTGYPGTMPARMTPTGIGTTPFGYVTGYVKGTGNPGEGSCSVSGCGTHSGTPMAGSDARW